MAHTAKTAPIPNERGKASAPKSTSSEAFHDGPNYPPSHQHLVALARLLARQAVREAIEAQVSSRSPSKDVI